MKRILLLVAGCAALTSAAALEKIALVDCGDYSGEHYDPETAAGVEHILDRVLKTGADTVLWRSHGGAIIRYPTAQENVFRLDHPLDRRRLPCRGVGRELWLLDRFELLSRLCETRPQVRHRGVHACIEEAHWNLGSVGDWNLAHPQYWCRSAEGVPMMFHASFAYPELVEHRLAMIREMIDKGMDTIYVDTYRSGNYGAACDYTAPNLAEWERRHPGEKPPAAYRPSDAARWNEWAAIVARGQHAYLRGIRRLIGASGRKVRFFLGVDWLTETDFDYVRRIRAIDWETLAREGTVDGLLLTGVGADKADPYGSYERIVREVRDRVGPRCALYVPVNDYNFNERRPSFQQLAKWAGITPEMSIKRLCDIANRVGAAGIVMECVDPDNYGESYMKTIRECR